MSYAQYGLVQSTDFNNFSANTNSVWSTGSGNQGLGQTAVATVAQGGTVTASTWKSLVNSIANIAAHQGTTITAVTAPNSGDLIAYKSAMSTNITSIKNNSANATAQGSTSATTTSTSTSWSDKATFTHTVSFANADAARYFFNSGGQLAITFNHSNTTAGINKLYSDLASQCGTIVFSSPTGSSTATIASTAYTGTTKVGGQGAINTNYTLTPSVGYYSLTTTPQTVFNQTASVNGSLSGYVTSYISVSLSSNGTQGSNGDKGNVITITTLWDEVSTGNSPASGGLPLASGATSTTITVRPPSTTYIANTWGTVTVNGTVSVL